MTYENAEVKIQQRSSDRASAPGFEPLVEMLLTKLAQRGYYPTPIIDLGVVIASADGTVDDAEMIFLEELFSAAFGEQIPSRVVRHLVVAGQEVTEQAGVSSRIRLLAEIFADADAVEDALRIGFALAYANNEVHEKEIELVRELATVAGFPREAVDKLSRDAKRVLMPDVPSLRKLSSVAPSSTRSE
jgi:tellurite resistance protein